MAESIPAMFSLAGKVALVTGASRGIGEEIAGVYAGAGARVAICGRKPEGVKEAAERLGKDGRQVLGVAANVAVAQDRAKLVQAVLDWAGRIDILVNNAGGNPGHGPLAEVSEQAWDRVFEANVKAPLFLSQLVYQAWMKNHGGVIINMASAGGFVVTAGINAYNISKAALVHLTRCLASEWGHDGVRVNAIAPGLIRTRFSQMLWDGPEGPELVERHPVPRVGEVEDVAGAALLLASAASSFMTGHTLVVDGGQLLCFSG
ncbi:MAG TPA: SDR family oxidoreductase [Spirochaetia bacterium]|nr:SDR family oxidoreductase [Spirochaetia bacterium]